MQKVFGLAKNNSHQKQNAKCHFWRRLFLNVKIWNIGVVAAICLVGVFYIANINNTAIKGFKTKDLDEQQASLKDSIKKLEYRVAELQSAQKIQERVGSLNMVEVGKVEYASMNGMVAKK